MGPEVAQWTSSNHNQIARQQKLLFGSCAGREKVIGFAVVCHHPTHSNSSRDMNGELSEEEVWGVMRMMTPANQGGTTWNGGGSCVEKGAQRLSEPVKAPAWSNLHVKKTHNYGKEEEEGWDDEWLPPHEIVAREQAIYRMSSFSVMEGVGRTLKGRDLRNLRNAVWRQTGFID